MIEMSSLLFNMQFGVEAFGITDLHGVHRDQHYRDTSREEEDGEDQEIMSHPPSGYPLHQIFPLQDYRRSGLMGATTADGLFFHTDSSAST